LTPADAAEIAVLQLPNFKSEGTEPIGTEGIEALAKKGSFGAASLPDSDIRTIGRVPP
jgi:hypothetical protein